MPRQRLTRIVLFASLAAAGCGGREETTTQQTAQRTPPSDTPVAATPAPTVSPTETKAVADLAPLGGGGVTGKVTFTERGDTVSIEAEVSGLTPGDHGFHIHEVGDCSASDGASAGAHFNPDNAEHGPFDPALPHHAGDLGNLVAGEDGRATLKAETGRFTLIAGARSILGQSVIVHEKADDLKTQPGGNSGGRIACGVIKAMEAGAAAAATPGY